MYEPNPDYTARGIAATPFEPNPDYPGSRYETSHPPKESTRQEIAPVSYRPPPPPSTKKPQLVNRPHSYVPIIPQKQSLLPAFDSDRGMNVNVSEHRSTRSHIRQIGVPVLPTMNYPADNPSGYDVPRPQHNKAFIRHLENHRRFDTMKNLRSVNSCPICQMFLSEEDYTPPATDIKPALNVEIPPTNNFVPQQKASPPQPKKRNSPCQVSPVEKEYFPQESSYQAQQPLPYPLYDNFPPRDLPRDGHRSQDSFENRFREKVSDKPAIGLTDSERAGPKAPGNVFQFPPTDLSRHRTRTHVKDVFDRSPPETDDEATMTLESLQREIEELSRLTERTPPGAPIQDWAERVERSSSIHLDRPGLPRTMDVVDSESLVIRTQPPRATLAHPPEKPPAAAHATQEYSTPFPHSMIAPKAELAQPISSKDQSKSKSKSPENSTPPKVQEAKAYKSYKKHGEGDMSIEKGEKLELFEANGKWARVRNAKGQIGFVPCKYLLVKNSK